MAGNTEAFYPGNYNQMIRPATYNLPVGGIVKRETFLPGNTEFMAELPGAYRDDSYVTAGYSYQPDSYTPGTYQFDANCVGQNVQVYPERESKVLWCGERNL